MFLDSSDMNYSDSCRWKKDVNLKQSNGSLRKTQNQMAGLWNHTFLLLTSPLASRWQLAHPTVFIYIASLIELDMKL